ncbi:unnamed protein product [Microthlaspi erraticum]|uniref:Retrotransposon Copia-like N-terminal domain-containing protein n=1 Tax=Microthlaspi erraticum TaxID=1685480 RepID=A0A6D2J8V7_9BRAS|nr:unnamed protein product [Microthlaspi erraticum]
MAAETSMKSSPELDFGSPYYMDREFYFGFDPVPVILSLEEDNYVHWKIRFQTFLRIVNKLGFVDGTLEKPDQSSPLYKLWEQNDSRVTCWLLNSMSEKVQMRLYSAETARDLWERTKQIFVPNLDLKIYQVRRKIAKLRQGGDSVATYYRKLSDAWMDLSEYDPAPECACGGCKCEIKKRAREAREKEELFAFLMGLNKSLSFMSAILMFKKPPPPLHEAYFMVEQAESDLKRSR